MGRNYIKEYEWSKKKYERVLADIDKDIGVKLKNKLKNDSNYNSIASWIEEKAIEYLNENKN